MDPQLKIGIEKCEKSCKTAVAALSANTRRQGGTIPPGLDDVFAQLLNNLRQTVTSLGLAVKPPVTVPAALDQLDKISDHIGKLISCILIALDGKSTIMAGEWKGGVVEIEWETEKYLDALKSGGDHLAHTGMVWEAIDRLLRDLPRDEKGALTRRLKAQQALVKDAWEEFKEILEGEQEADGWDELGLDSELSEADRVRTEAAKPLFALYQLLFGMIPRYLDDVQDHAMLGETATSFVDIFDSAVSSMHPEQDEDDIEAALSELQGVSSRLVNLAGEANFTRWQERLAVEQKKWGERRLDLGSLSKAIE